MIQREQDGQSLSYVDSNGTKHTVPAFTADWSVNPDFVNLQSIWKAQQGAVLDNEKRRLVYLDSLSKATPATVPAKPLFTVVDDTGKVTYNVFVPPLPEFVPLPEQVIPPPNVGGLPVVDWNKPVDQVTETHDMVKAIYRKIMGV